MTFLTYLLMAFLVGCAIAASFSRNLLNSILIFMSYSLVMSIIWILLESPDLAITEAAVGAGVTSILFFVTLKKIRAIQEERQETGPESAEAPAGPEGAEETEAAGAAPERGEKTDQTAGREGGR